MAAAGATAAWIRETAAKVVSFEPRLVERYRERLSPSEQRLVRYVVSEWAGDATGGSRWSDMIQAEERAKALAKPAKDADDSATDVEALAVREASKRAIRLALRTPGKTRRERREEAWARADEALRLYCQTQYVPSAGSASKLGAVDAHGYPLLEGAEQWSQRGRKAAAEIVRAWRALTALDRDEPRLASVLVRLYGDRPPGDRSSTLFDRSHKPDVCAEYVRVADCVGLGSWPDILRATRRTKAEGPETALARAALVRELSKRSEALIAAAARGYRAAWARAEG